MLGSFFRWLLGSIAFIWERMLPWHKLPFPLTVLITVGNRQNLRKNNLWDTETNPRTVDGSQLPADFDVDGWRTPDGTFNDKDVPWMGMASSRFGRNVPPQHGFGEDKERLLAPNPREISNRLLRRTVFRPAPHLNLLIAGWIQFMVHDWLSHGPSAKADPILVPRPADDDWPEGLLCILRTKPDPEALQSDAGRTAAYLNKQTHWWDGSQIYGSDWVTMERLRMRRDGTRLDNGKLWLDEDGLLPTDLDGQELSGENGNWWSGLSILHTLFAREHNAIADRLRIEHPNRDGEWVFQKSRLINAALIAKIHTVEWTPALMNSASGQLDMRGNYWGVQGERLTKAWGRLTDDEVLSGIMGSSVDHHGAPFAMTEEFADVYRFHSLLPDQFSLRNHRSDDEVAVLKLDELLGGGAWQMYQREGVGFADVLYSHATQNPGLLALHNFPHALQKLTRSNSSRSLIDLATVDIIRSRERGIPRYAEFRRLLGAAKPTSFADITDNVEDQKSLSEIYASVEDVDLLVGCLAESESKRNQPPGFGFSDTAFRVFILMASRRLKSDRFYTNDFRPEIYTKAGFNWISENGFKDVILRHCPELSNCFEDIRNPFFPWSKPNS